MASRRSLWAWRKGEEVALGTVAANGGGGRSRAAARREPERERELGSEGKRRGVQGGVAVSVALEGPRGREAGREEATASPALATELLRGEGRKTTGGGGLGQVAGLANSVGPSRWLRWTPGKLAQVSLSPLFIVSVFYYSATLWLYEKY